MIIVHLRRVLDLLSPRPEAQSAQRLILVLWMRRHSHYHARLGVSSKRVGENVCQFALAIWNVIYVMVVERIYNTIERRQALVDTLRFRKLKALSAGLVHTLRPSQVNKIELSVLTGSIFFVCHHDCDVHYGVTPRTFQVHVVARYSTILICDVDQLEDLCGVLTKVLTDIVDDCITTPALAQLEITVRCINQIIDLLFVELDDGDDDRVLGLVLIRIDRREDVAHNSRDYSLLVDVGQYLFLVIFQHRINCLFYFPCRSADTGGVNFRLDRIPQLLHLRQMNLRILISVNALHRVGLTR